MRTETVASTNQEESDTAYAVTCSKNPPARSSQLPGIVTPSRLMLVADARRDGKRFVVRADEKLVAFMELESAIRER